MTSVPSAALDRAPFVAVIIALLGAGIAAVLWLNTMTDEAGLQTSTARSNTTDLRLSVEALERDVAMLDSTRHIAEAAAELGLVPAGDAAMLIVDAAGNATLVGEPSAVPGAAPQTPIVDPAGRGRCRRASPPTQAARTGGRGGATRRRGRAAGGRGGRRRPAAAPAVSRAAPADEAAPPADAAAPPVVEAAPPADAPANPPPAGEPAAPAEGTQP